MHHPIVAVCSSDSEVAHNWFTCSPRCCDVGMLSPAFAIGSFALCDMIHAVELTVSFVVCRGGGREQVGYGQKMIKHSAEELMCRPEPSVTTGVEHPDPLCVLMLTE